MSEVLGNDVGTLDLSDYEEKTNVQYFFRAGAGKKGLWFMEWITEFLYLFLERDWGEVEKNK